MSIRLSTSELGEESYWFWCPGCDTHHRFVTKNAPGQKGPEWTFDGNLERPTFAPSLLVWLPVSDPRFGPA